LRGLRNLGVDTRDRKEDHDGKERGEEGGKGILNATVLGDLNNLGNGPANKVHPRHRRGEGKTTNNGVEGLGLEFLGDKVYGLKSSVGHCDCYTIHWEKN
tara:strand:+ start:1001 stop:1300 length:300 start_codon:yes stop_codon:yes gene_type:complete